MSPRPNVGTEQQVWTEVFNRLPSDWTAVAGTGTETLVTLATGQNVLQAAGYRWRTYPVNIKFNPTWLYRIRIRVRRTATTDALTQSIFIGCAGVREDGTSLCAVDGTNSHFSQHYFAAASQDMTAFPLGEWQEFIGYFRGWAAAGSGQSLSSSAPGAFHESVRYFRPLFILNYNGGPAGNVTQIGNFIVEAIQQPTTEFVHLISADFSGGTLYLNTGARDLYWNGQTWEGIGGTLTFDAVQEANEEKGRGVQFQLAGVDQTIVATLLNNNYRGRVVRVYRAYLDPVSGQVIDPTDRGIQIVGTTARFAIKNPVGTWVTTNLTLEVWARLDNYGAGAVRTLASYAVTGQVSEIQLDKSTADKLRLTIKGTSVSSAAAFPNDGKWHHYAVSWASSGGAWAMYVDGVLTDSGTGLQSAASITAAGSWVLGQFQAAVGGSFDATRCWNGLLDTVRLYSRVIPVTEIAEHFRGVLLDTAGLPVSTWSFDDPNTMGKDGSRDNTTSNDLTLTGIQLPSEGSDHARHAALRRPPAGAV